MSDAAQSPRSIDDEIRLEYHGKVAVITIDRPHVGNALNPPCRDRIRDLFNEFNVNHRARAVILTASGEKLFCPGADLSHVYENDRADDIPARVIGDPRRMMMDGQYTLFPALLDCDVPVIAAVNGTAAGMGAHLALACDLALQDMVDEATAQHKPRRATKPTYGSKQRRLEGKAVRAQVKAGRGRVRGE